MCTGRLILRKVQRVFFSQRGPYVVFVFSITLTRLCLAYHKKDSEDLDHAPQSAASDQGLNC